MYRPNRFNGCLSFREFFAEENILPLQNRLRIYVRLLQARGLQAWPHESYRILLSKCAGYLE